MRKEINTTEIGKENPISRKVAIHRVGKYAAFTAASMMLLMSPVDSSAAQKSPAKPRRH